MFTIFTNMFKCVSVHCSAQWSSLNMSDEKPVQLKRQRSSSVFSWDNDLTCIVHYEHSRDSEIRPLSESQYRCITESAAIRQASAGDGHRLDSICSDIPQIFDANLHGAHRWCYKNFTNVSRLRSRSTTVTPAHQTTPPLRSSARSSCTSRPCADIFPQDKCLFCGCKGRYNKGSKEYHLVKCVTETAEASIKEAARVKNDFKLLGTIDGVDLIAKEARYHELCRRDYVRETVRRRHSDDESSSIRPTSQQRSAYDDAFDWLCEHIRRNILASGHVERMSMLRDRFLQYVETFHPDVFNPLYTSQKLKNRIISNFGDQLTFWLPQQLFKSELVFASNLDVGEAVEAAFSLSSSEEAILNKAADILRRNVTDDFSSSPRQPWPPTVASLKSVNPPQILKNFMIRLISGKPASNPDLADNVLRLADSMSEDMCSAVTKSKWVMPKHVLLGMSLRHLTGSAEIVTILNRYGHCQSYSKLLQLETALAYQAKLSDRLPPGISDSHNVVANLCFDNFDLLEETRSGAATTHSTHGIIIQELKPGTEPPSDAGSEVHKSGQRTFKYSHDPLQAVRQTAKAEPDVKPASLTSYNKTDSIALQQGCFAWTVCHGLVNSAQNVPEWTGWVSATAKERHVQPSNIRYLKPIMHPITQLSTIQECLKLAMDITQQIGQDHTFVTFDLAAAKLALNLVWADSDKYKSVTVHLGAFHTMCSYMGAIGRMMTGSGFEEVVINSGVCASGSLDQVLTGKHFNRAIRVHGHVLSALERLLLQAFVDRHGFDIASYPELLTLATEPNASSLDEVENSPTIATMFNQFTAFLDEVRRGEMGKTAQFWVQYRDSVWSLFLFVKAVKTNDVDLYIYSMRQLCPMLFAADRQNYARYLPLYHSMLTQVSTEVYDKLMSNGISVSRSLVPGCRIPIDMAIEQTINRSAKTMGGISGFSRNVGAYYRWCLTRHKKAEFLEAVRDDCGFNMTSQAFVHPKSKTSNCKRTEQDIKKIVHAFTGLMNPFDLSTGQYDELYCLSSGRPADSEVSKDLLNYICTGEDAAAEFIKVRLMEKSISFHAPMKKLKLKTFADMVVSKKIPAGKQKAITVKAERNFLGQLLMLSQSNSISFDKLFQFSLSLVTCNG